MSIQVDYSRRYLFLIAFFRFILRSQSHQDYFYIMQLTTFSLLDIVSFARMVVFACKLIMVSTVGCFRQLSFMKPITTIVNWYFFLPVLLAMAACWCGGGGLLSLKLRTCSLAVQLSLA